MHVYLKALQDIYHNGIDEMDRTGTGTRSLFGAINMEFDLLHRGAPVLPLVTSKYVHYPALLHELIWMLSGSTNVQYLKENNVRIWDEWVQPETAVYRDLDYAERLTKLSKPQAGVITELRKELIQQNRSLNEIEYSVTKTMNDWGVPEKELLSGELGPVYGAQWRNWEDSRKIKLEETDSYLARGFEVIPTVDNTHAIATRFIDQIERLETALSTGDQKAGRRLILTAWNVSKLDEMALQPCHVLAQFKVHYHERRPLLSCKLYQRSGDFFLGVPFNIAFYAALTHMLASMHGMTPHKLYHSIGDAHIYSNHFDQVAEQLGRQPIKEPAYFGAATAYPKGKHMKSILEIGYEHLSVKNYKHHPSIKAPVAV